ncbi:MAG TPA: NAD synthetase [Candidatus Marinimicrobia bacterium]|jgi:NAD(P) transhydrogenase subunit beta|nr:NAD(P)(+) transhydrogenase (Re/Si-specific) subunit beta [Candidatus Neomarinimicrobiota bacterium]MDP6230404.1 NAD(P)(+) transhydrogenase (Re/Si-specific) subunit beta [Candidatus Neomarinimicrobiota bacterium]MDP7095653.1 NAD(P)(+) transhydrogenase (Re/Si-specific) subunit beta [Candidatus Neomarinimicrobiota bacterium]MDP7512587.1 NAD(P)(+) transhydrogenase (Re/Si-specific) subunit beta [Candidatus Neomarinimicrobiota bacterium]HBR86489.1 NAD synthetase [Candidatus Neomarinimicrobiota bac|tara:strand:+ start:223 stop:1593 length:1371 start_codon:yes stop_codon:yes gene_type:complete
MEYTNIAYVLAAILFILGIKRLSSPKTARSGNTIASVGMLIAIVATLVSYDLLDFQTIAIGMIIGAIIGALFAIKVEMTQMPQMVAIFNGFGGGASALVAAAEYFNPANPSTFNSSTIAISVFVGTLTFTGSFIAFGKLQGFISGQPIVFPGQKILNGLIAMSIVFLGVYTVSMGAEADPYFYGLVALAALIGITLTIPIGGADMPVVISLLNSYSGVAAAATGFVLMNNGLIISGALVGASGLILTNIMCKGMNRSLANVIFGAVGLTQVTSGESGKQIQVKSASTEEAAMILEAAEKIIVVPGYGLAVAQAQHAIREVADFLENMGKKVLYAIHPVAGRMPGHMNVLLAEANVPYEQLLDLDQVNPEFEDCDVAIVLGANDVVNPAARHDTGSPIYGMPILDVDKSKTVLVNKRTMNPGFAGIQNELFGFDNTLMVFGDAKAMLTDLHKDLKEL